MSKMKTSEILEKAADICARGWTQGKYDDGAGCHCMEGALFLVMAGELGSRADVFRAVERGIGAPGIVHWNDAPGRTQAEVVAKLREVAALERAAGR